MYKKKINKKIQKSKVPIKNVQNTKEIIKMIFYKKVSRQFHLALQTLKNISLELFCKKYQNHKNLQKKNVNQYKSSKKVQKSYKCIKKTYRI